MKCPSCTGEIAGDSRFCAYCGITVPRCLSCGNLHPFKAAFCPQCGVPTQDIEENSLFNSGMILPDEDEKWKQNQDPRVGFLFKPDFPEHRFYLKDGDITVGAGDKNTIVIDKPAVSWNHAIIITRNDTVRIQDSASTNGTFVNDQRLTRPRNLVHGDDVRFANVAYTVWIKPKLREIS